MLINAYSNTLEAESLEQLPTAVREYIRGQWGCDPGEVPINGDFHTFRTPGDATSRKSNNEAGYVCVDLQRMVCIIGSYRPDEIDSTVLNLRVPGSPEPTEEARQALREQALAHRRQVQETVARQAQGAWQKCVQDLPDFAYLQERGVMDIARRIAETGELRYHGSHLAIPLRDRDHQLWNLQTIAADGQKRFFGGGRVKGLGVWIGGLPTGEQEWFVVEGYAKALAVHQATGWPVLCTYSAHNLRACVEEFQSRVDLRRGILAADNDAAGQAGANAALSAFPTLRAIYPAVTGDWNDILVKQGLVALQAALTPPAPAPANEEAAPVSVEGPAPLCRSVEAPEDYPVSAFSLWSGLLERVSSTMNVAPAMVGQSLLAATCLSAQGLANVLIDGRVYPLSEFFITIASSGERKSSIDKLLMNPHRQYEQAQKLIVDEAKEKALRAKKAWQANEAQTLKDNKGKPQAVIEAALAALGSCPVEPPSQILSIADLTIEGLIRFLNANRPSVGSMTDEGGRMLGGWGLGKDHITKTIAAFSALWDGSPLVHVRAGDGTLQLYDRRVCAHWQAQPGVAERLFRQAEFADQGFLWRVLVVHASLTTPAPYQPVDLSADPVVQTYYARIQELLAQPLPLKTDSQGLPTLELAPRLLTLDPEAKALWIDQFNRLEGLAAENGPLFPIRGYARKGAEHIARLAGIYTLLNDPQAQTVPVEAVQFGATLMLDFYIPEMLRLHEGQTVSPEIHQAERLRQWLKGRDFIHLQQVYQSGPRLIRSKSAALIAIQTLVNHGWLVPISGGMVLQGVKRKEVWQVVDEAGRSGGQA